MAAKSRNTFTQASVTRALKAAKAAGVDLACTRIDIHPNGTISLAPSNPNMEGDASANPWDEVLDQ